MHFSEFFLSYDAYFIFTDVGGRAQIRIIGALLGGVTNLLATSAPHQFAIASKATLLISLVIVILLLAADMLAELAARL
jgi:hypothetical protein